MRDKANYRAAYGYAGFEGRSPGPPANLNSYPSVRAATSMETVDSLTAIAAFPHDDSQLMRASGPWSFLNLTPLAVLTRDNGTSSFTLETAGCIACATTTALASLQDCAKLSARRYLHPILAWRFGKYTKPVFC